ncbi:MAG: hypothetical protein KIT10_00300 [Flavobacteriales bacterium]|nr:hypothetical protein [Flavobacteriales bacterium]
MCRANILRHSIALLGTVLLAGCLTIEEHYTFKKDGSGSMTYVVDMSGLGEMMNSFGDMGGTPQDDMGTMDLSAEVGRLKTVPGVSKVKLDAKKKWVQKISFNFKDVTALNAALNELLKDSSGVRQDFFRWEDGTLVRSNNRHAHELGAGIAAGEDGGDDDEFGMNAMLESMKYRYSFKFARPIGQVSSADGVLRRTTGTKEIGLETDFAVISRDPSALDLRITLDK